MKTLYVKPRKLNLTTKEFYDDILKQVKPCFVEECEYKEVEFNFNELRNINPMTLALLFVLGEELTKRKICPVLNIIPRIDDNDFKNIHYFMEYSGFYKVNETLQNQNPFFKVLYDRGEVRRFKHIKFDYMEVELDCNNKPIIDLNAIWRKASTLNDILKKGAFKDFLERYFIKDDIYSSEIDHFIQKKFIKQIYEIMLNSLDHGKTGCAMSFSYVEKFNVLYISLADCGIGLSKSLEEKEEKIYSKLDVKEEAKEAIYRLFELSRRDPDYKETYMILISLILRMTKKDEYSKEENDYGLASVIDFILKNDGYFRIHSNDTRIILSKRFYKYMNLKGIEKLADVLKENEDTNLFRNIYFPGVHIEFELDLNNLSTSFWEEVGKQFLLEIVNA